MFSQEVMDMLIKGIGETLYMTLGATIFGYRNHPVHHRLRNRLGT